MRIIKLGTQEFPSSNDVDRFFREKLKSPDQRGRFYFARTRISAQGIQPGEYVLFSYCTRVLYRGMALTGRQFDSGRKGGFQFYFSIDAGSICSVTGVDLYQVQSILDRLLPVRKNLVRSRAWLSISDQKASNEVWKLAGGALAQEPNVRRKYGSGGEGPEHRNLKNKVASNTGLIGLTDVIETHVEHRFMSGDRVDILFVLANGTSEVVEIETTDPCPGGHQAIKYRVLRCAEEGWALGSKKVGASLVAWAIDDDVRSFCNRYGIRAIEIR